MDAIRTRAQEIWNQLAPWQRIASLAILVAGVALLGVVALWLQEPSYAVLYRDLSDKDAAAITAVLEQQNIPYRLGEGGTLIQIPADQIAKVRLQLAAQNLPRDGFGYELFDGSAFEKLGMTEFMQRVNYQRALEGELARTIKSIEGVQDARVHIVLPEERLFMEQQQDPKASVVLELAPGMQLAPEQVEAVRNLVANSVEGMEPANVAVVDVEGRVYDPPATGELALATLTSSQIQIQRTVEMQKQRDLQAMLDQTLGPGKAIVRVTVEMDWDQVESQVELVAPAGEVGSVLKESRREEVRWEGAGGQAVGGAPGVDANAPADVPSYQAGDEVGGTYEQTIDQQVFEVSRERTVRQRQPGAVKRISVAVLVDDVLPEDQLEAVQSLVEAAVGIDPERGDVVQIQRIPFNEDFFAQQAAAFDQARKQELYLRIGMIVAALLGLGLILFFLRRMFNDIQRRMMPYVVEPEPPALNGNGPLPSLQQQAAAAYGAADQVLPGSTGEMELPSPDDPELRLKAVARHNPDVVASVLQSWMEQGQPF